MLYLRDKQFVAGLFLSSIFFLGLFAFSPVVYGADLLYQSTKVLSGGDNGQSGQVVDSSGNLFVAGQFAGTVDFDPSGVTDDKTSAGGNDVFLSKYNAAGTYQWTKVMGGAGEETAFAIKKDTSDNLYIVGTYSGTVDFDPSGATDEHISNGGLDAFLVSFNNSGVYRFAETFGGSQDDYANTVAIHNGSHQVFVGGDYADTVDFDPSGVTENHTSNGNSDIFVASFSTVDGSYNFAKTMGGTGFDSSYSLAVDGSNHFYVAGPYAGTVDFDPSGSTDDKPSNGSYEAYVSSFDTDGTYRFTKTFGSTSIDYVTMVATDSDDNIYLTGQYNGTVDFDPSGATDNHTGSGCDGSPNFYCDVFLSSFTSSGTFRFTKTFGSTGGDVGHGIFVDTDNNVYVAGLYTGTVDFDPSSGTDNHTSNGGYDVFLASFDSAGVYRYTKTVGGTAGEDSFAFALDTSNNFYYGGWFSGTVDFDPSSGTNNKTSGGSGANQSSFISLFTLDNDAPDITPTALDSTMDTTPTFQGTATDTAATVTSVDFRVDSGSFASCTADDGTFDAASEDFSCTPATALSLGDYTIYFRATDSSGNTTVSADYASLNVTIGSVASNGHNRYYKLYKKYKNYRNDGSKQEYKSVKLLKKTNLAEFERLKGVFEKYRLAGKGVRNALNQKTKTDYDRYRKYQGYKLYLYYKNRAHQ